MMYEATPAIGRIIDNDLYSHLTAIRGNARHLGSMESGGKVCQTYLTTPKTKQVKTNLILIKHY